MSISRIHHSFVFSLTTILTATQCLASPLIYSRNEGTSVLSVNSVVLARPKSSSSIIPGWSDPTAIVFFVAVASLFLTVPMFVYIWMRRRRLHAARQRSRNQQGELEVANELRKELIPSTPEALLIAVAVSKESVEAERKGSMEEVRKGSVGTGSKGAARGMRKVSVRVLRPVQVSVKPTRAVEIMVKPPKVAFRDQAWEKLKT